MVQLKKTLDSALSEIRSKRSLQYGLLAMALLFCSVLYAFCILECAVAS